jgi:rod shape determining protein RodA
VVFGSIGGAVFAVFESRGTPWQLLHDYQYRRIDTFLDPTTDPLGAATTSPRPRSPWARAVRGQGLHAGHAVALNFLPEKHTDFISTPWPRSSASWAPPPSGALRAHPAVPVLGRPAGARPLLSLLITGIGGELLLLFAVNMLMVMGLAPGCRRALPS